MKTIPGKQFPVKHYDYDDARNFRQWNEDEPPSGKKYLSPVFGFVTPLFEKPREPSGRAQRLYTTRPFFRGFDNDAQPERELLGVRVTKALPGSLVVLSEGSNRKGFYICRTCGKHEKERIKHKTPEKRDCSGMLEHFSLGHELVTDVVRLRFPRLTYQWDAYSLAYAILLGAAETLDVPGSDLNITITGTGAETASEAAIVLYDNVPGGAGLVAQTEQEKVFRAMLGNARERLQGNCGCDSSCYGCLRSYRNQFAHPHLDRARALAFLNAALGKRIPSN